MATSPAAPVPNPVQRRDADVLTGILAILEGRSGLGSSMSGTTGKVAERFAQQGLLGADYGQHDLRQAINRHRQSSSRVAG